MIRAQSRERGFALAATIFALVLVGALVTGGFFAASQESRIGTSSQFSSEAFYYAERGLEDALGTYNRGWLEASMPMWPDSMMDLGPTVITSNGQDVGQFTVDVRRLDSLLYYIESTGQVLEGGEMYSGATRTLGVVARTVSLNMPMDRALQIFGQISIGGTSEVDGRDSRPSAWTDDCNPLFPDVAGVVTRDSGNVDVSGSGEILGSPLILEDPAMDTAAFEHFGDLTYDEMVHMADKHIPSAWSPINNTAPSLNANGTCNTSDDLNWGDPFNRGAPCYNYFPIIHAEAPVLHLNGNTFGQGILLVDGDLVLTGGFQFFGIAIIKGKLKTTGKGGHLNGITMVKSGGELDSNWESIARGNSEVNFSSCAIERAVNNNPWTSRIVRLGQRSWIDVTAAGG